MKDISQILMEINPTELYKPNTIAQKGWLYGYKNPLTSYFTVLKLIKQNKLRAKNFGQGKTPYYKILGSDLIRYLEMFR